MCLRGRSPTSSLALRCAVEVEAHLQLGVPAFAIAGLPDKACQEAKERVRGGIASAELEWPSRRITVNPRTCASAQGGLWLRSPDRARGARRVAAGRRPSPAGHAAVGELALDGRVRPVPGTLAYAEAARRARLARIICSRESTAGASLAGVETVPVRHLAEACAYLRGEHEPDEPARPPERAPPAYPDLADVHGQEGGRRRSSWLPRGITTSCLPGRQVPGRPCLPVGSRGFFPV